MKDNKKSKSKEIIRSSLAEYLTFVQLL